MEPNLTRWTHVPSPLGPLLLVRGAHGLSRIELPASRGRAARPPEGGREEPRACRDAARQLAAYFAGELREFELDLAPEGTPFQLVTWKALREIPHGETWSYADLARRIGRPTATRAVGAANGRNPLPIVVPCHRVIGSGGELRGFGGGVAAKRLLLEIEGAACVAPLASQSKLFT